MKKNVLVIPEIPPSKSPGGIIIPDIVRKKYRVGKVLQVGSEVTDIKEGDRVSLQQGGFPVMHEGKPALIFPDELINGIINETNE